MQRAYSRGFAALFALFIAFGLALPARALPDTSMKTVRVGFYHTEGYHVMDEQGNRSGYGYEVLQSMKLYNDWAYEYIGYDKGWADIQKMLVDGEIDLVVSAIKTPARMEVYDFSERALAQSGASLLVKAGESPYVAGRYEGYDGMRIGFIENSAQIASAQAFAKDKGFTYVPVYYKTSAELESAIQAGTDVDAIVTSNMRIIAGTRRLQLFDMQDVYAMVRKGDGELLDEVNYALEQISLYSPGLYDELYDKYYTVDMGDSVFYSPDEREFIDDCIRGGYVVRATIVPDMSPYSYFENGEPKGILYEITDEIMRRTGLKYDIAYTRTDAEYRSLIENKGVDLRLVARFDYNYAEAMGYTLIDPYYETDVSRITRKGYDGAIRSIAVVKNSLIDLHYLPMALNGESVLYYETVSDCVQAVKNGRCDATYQYTRTAQEAVYNDVTNRITSVIMPSFALKFTIGVRENADARLASILEKAAASMSNDDIARFVLAYTDYPLRPQTLIGMLYDSPVYVLVFVAVMLFLTFSTIMLFYVLRKRSQEKEHNLQLQSALATARQANAAKSVFMSRMSHEIRTPLNAIIGYNSISCTALAEAENKEDCRRAVMKALDYLAKSDIASKLLLNVINDVLDMSAIESGKIRMARELFDFRGMIMSLSAMFYSQARAKGVDFTIAFHSPTDEWFTGDQMRVSQILTNLLSNAVKFTPGGGRIRLRISQQHNKPLRFEVKDTGIGMSGEFLKNIFAPFEQADASISRRFGGTGLGLSITKNLVDLMGGEIRVESAEGEGSTFTVELPLERADRPAARIPGELKNANALIVDIDADARAYLTMALNAAGARCVAVSTGEEALNALSEGGPYAVCVFDWRLPDAQKTVARMRELAGDSAPRFIAADYDVSEIDARAAGVDECILKPMFPSAVYDIMSGAKGGAAKAKAGARKADFGGARVLVAEDNKTNMDIARLLLSSWNIVIDKAWDGREAADMFASSPEGYYSAILMDVHMPEMDGYSATREIRASSRADAKSIPIFAMTADVFAEDVAKAADAGMNAHIGKPIDKQSLLALLQKYMGGE